MAATIIAALDRIAADFEAVTPPDRIEAPYRRLRARLPQDYARQFSFAPPVRAETVGQSSTGTMVVWEVDVLVMVDGTGRGYEDRSKAAANESDLLARTIEKRTIWPFGVYEILIDKTTLDVSEETQDINLTLSLRVLTMETV